MTGTGPAARTLERGIRYATLAVFAVGVRRRNAAAAVNAVLAFAACHVPDLVERRYGTSLRPWQRLYAATAMLVHAIGMLGFYDHRGWWDHVTHTLSASLLGGFVHAAARRRGRDPRPRVLGVVVGAGVLWELVEYAIHAVSDRLGLEPVLVHYSARDTELDLVFDLVGALLALALGDRLLGNVVRDGD